MEGAWSREEWRGCGVAVRKIVGGGERPVVEGRDGRVAVVTLSGSASLKSTRSAKRAIYYDSGSFERVGL